MDNYKPVPFVTETTEGRSKRPNCSTLINLYAERNPENSKYPWSLHGTPGQKSFATVGAGPIRAGERLGRYLYLVSGTSVYRVDASGTAVEMGSIGSVDPVYMAASRQEIAISCGGLGYRVDASSFAQITDADFPIDVTSVAMIGGYHVWTRENNDQFVVSALRDATSYDPTDFATAEAAPDILRRPISLRRQIYFFGEETIEPWYLSGATFPLSPIGGALIERGTANPESIVRADNTLVWVGDDYIVYRLDGYTPRRISTFAVETAIDGKSNLVGMTYSQAGHKFYVLTIPGERTFVYDFATKLWHERQTYNEPDWAPRHCFEIWNKVLVAGGSNTVTELDLKTYDDNGTTIQAVGRTVPYGTWPDMSMNEFLIDFEPGIGLTAGQGSDPQVMLRWSDDGCNTWSNEIWAGIGARGKYGARARWGRLGNFTSRTMEFTVSDPIPRHIVGAYADVSQ